MVYNCLRIFGLSNIIYSSSLSACTYDILKNPVVCIFLLLPWMLDVTLLCVSYYKSTTYTPGNSSPNNVSSQRLSTFSTMKTLKNWNHMLVLKKNSRNYGVLSKKSICTFLYDLRNQIQSLNETSYCFRCEVVKEPRTHHCSICNKCILRMDHHCPWTGNCVGKQNHKYFILFLLYATVNG